MGSVPGNFKYTIEKTWNCWWKVLTGTANKMRGYLYTFKPPILSFLFRPHFLIDFDEIQYGSLYQNTLDINSDETTNDDLVI